MFSSSNVTDAFIILQFLKQNIYDNVINYLKTIILTYIFLWQLFLSVFTKPLFKLMQLLIQKNTDKTSNPSIDLWNFIITYMNIELIIAIPCSLIWIPNWLFSNIVINTIIFTLIELVLLSFMSVRILNIYGKESFKTLNCHDNMVFENRFEKIKTNCGVNTNLMDIMFVYLLTFGSHIYPLVKKIFFNKNYKDKILDYFENYELNTINIFSKTIIKNSNISYKLMDLVRSSLGNEKNKILFIGRFTLSNNNNDEKDSMIPVTPKVNYQFPSLSSINLQKEDELSINNNNKTTNNNKIQLPKFNKKKETTQQRKSLFVEDLDNEQEINNIINTTIVDDVD